MTDQRERVSTDPGIGPVDADNPGTLRSIEAAVEVEPDGASLYYEPLPLRAVSDHRTLEMETVKISQEIDPRKLPTEISLPRSPIPPHYDSGWPQADLVLTSSQRPAPPRRHWRVPALLLGVLVALLVLVLARSAVQRAAERGAASSLRGEPVAQPASAPKLLSAAALPVANTALPVANTALPVANTALSAADTALPVANTALPVANTALPVANTALPVANTALSAVPAAGASVASHAAPPVVVVPHRAPPAAAMPSAALVPSSSPPSAPSAKPKRAIY